VFTSTRDGDLEIYTMRADGTDIKRLTHETGYDGGAFFSADGKKIVYRAHHPKESEAIARYKELLADGLIEPRALEIYVMDADGTNKRQVTGNGAANFAPYFHPDGKKIIFSSNLSDSEGRNFDLYIINEDGTGLEHVTTDPSFDGFPMFTDDGKKLVFASNRNAQESGETNVFIADWIP
jgi:Tol biopolymer transport system component